MSVTQRRAGELPPASLPPNGVSLLSRIRAIGHDGDATEELPPMELGYTEFAPTRQTFRPLQAADGALPGQSLADHDLEMVGLFGNGLPDLVQLDGSARFWRNLGGDSWTLLAAPASLAGLAAPGQAFTLRFEVVGSALKLYVNGAEQVSATDTALTGGQAGILATAGNSFAKVQVS